MITFLKLILRHLAALCLAFLAFFLLLFLLLLGFGAMSEHRELPLKEGTVLNFDLSRNISDAPQTGSIDEFFEGLFSGSEAEELHLKAVLDAVEEAGEDDRISTLFLHGSFEPTSFGSNFVNLAEIRAAVRGFSERGKPVIAYLVAPSLRDYFLASAADSVYLNPLGFLTLNGLAANLMFLGDAFEKYGIGVQTFNAGKYKSAGEPFTRNNLSPENREQIQLLVEGIWETVLEGIGEGRNLEVSDLQTLTDRHGILQPEQAVEFGLVDELRYFDEVLQELYGSSGAAREKDHVPQTTIAAYSHSVAAKAAGGGSPGEDVLAVVYMEGEIVDGEGDLEQVGGSRFSRALRKLRKDEKVKAVVLRVNSPGGSAMASEVIEREIRLLGVSKPVVVSMGGLAASGGYWVSAQAETIFAESATVTGSIGVFGLFPNIEKLANRHGITFDGVKTSRFADLFSISRPKTVEEMGLFQDLTDSIYNHFVVKVGEGRGLSQERVEEIAQGRIWTGADALEVGLVDKIGGLDAAIREAADLASLGEDWILSQYPKKLDFAERVAKVLSGPTHPPLSYGGQLLSPELDEIGRDLFSLRSFNDPRGIYARLPFFLHVD